MLPTYSLNYMQVFIVAAYADDYFQTMYEQELWIIIYQCFIYSQNFPMIWCLFCDKLLSSFISDPDSFDISSAEQE